MNVREKEKIKGSFTVRFRRDRRTWWVVSGLFSGYFWIQKWRLDSVYYPVVITETTVFV